MTKKNKNKNKKSVEETTTEEVAVAEVEVSEAAVVAFAQDEAAHHTATEETPPHTLEELNETALEASGDENVAADTDVASVPSVQLVSDINEIEAAVLALVFASPVALSSKKLKNLLTFGGYEASQLDLVLESLFQSFEQKGIQLVKVAGGYQLRSNPKYAEIVQKLVEEKPQRLGKSALEVLSIVAYKQPITRADIDHVRGTDSGHLLKGLLEKNLVRTEGHKESAGRPLLYGTTPYFLEVFTLGSLDDLPAIEDFERELKDIDSENGEGNVLNADPGFFSNASLDANAERGDYDAPAEEAVDAPDFGVADRAREEVETTH